MDMLFPNGDKPPACEWLAIKKRLQQTLDPETFGAWIEPLNGKLIGESEIAVTLPNLVFYQGVHDRFLDHLERCKSDLGFTHLLLRFEIEGTVPTDDVANDLGFGFDSVSSNLTEPAANQVQKINPDQATISNNGGAFSRALTNEGHLNHTYTFDSFIRGDSNQFAVATCLAAAENPGRAYNPLFIYGSTGLGKTHLLHAVGNMVLKNNPNSIVAYIPSERFMNEMIYCLRFDRMFDFRQKYRNCDVFLVDDIQFISGKRATQEEFFHTFNTLYAAKKQIVITSDMFPKDIPDIEDRLRNRFQWGLIADIQPPSPEHRVAILLSKAESLKISLPQEVAEYIASRIRRNIRDLEGALNRIKAFAELQGEKINLNLAMRTFKDVLGEPPKRLSIETIQKIVADHFKLRVADLKGKRRQQNIALPRQIAMFLSRKFTNASYPDIGERFGGKDHTTVMHNVRKIEDCLGNDLDLRAHIESLERQLEQLQ